MRLRLQIVLGLIFLLLSFCLASAESEFITSNVLQRVFLIKYGKQFGTAFTLDVDSKQYLISSKHLLTELKESDVVEIYHGSTWKMLKVKRIDLSNLKIDILIMAPSEQLSPSLELEGSIESLIIGQDVYFLGFPFGLMDDAAKRINNGFPMPFVKKGVVSAFIVDKDAGNVLFVDGYNNHGFSGGPIVFYDYATKKFKVAAVVSGFYNDSAEVVKVNKEQSKSIEESGSEQPQYIAITNSGLFFGYTIEAVVEAIRKKPIGVKLGAGVVGGSS